MGLKNLAARTAKKWLPNSILDVIAYRRERRFIDRLGAKDQSAVFEAIYREGIWGAQPSGDGFFSGSGSHEPSIVGPYVDSVTRFLAEIGRPLVIVEVGCGDFFVGSQLVAHCDRYVACDIVKPLIERNRRSYTDTKLGFHVLDAVREELPKGDVLIVRQVLQHLSNADIALIVPKLSSFAHVIVTEHLPGPGPFVPNLDKPTGFDTRLNRSSGVELTAEPFNLRPTSAQVLCEAAEEVGIVRTTAYRM